MIKSHEHNSICKFNSAFWYCTCLGVQVNYDRILDAGDVLLLHLPHSIGAILVQEWYAGHVNTSRSIIEIEQFCQQLCRFHNASSGSKGVQSQFTFATMAEGIISSVMFPISAAVIFCFLASFRCDITIFPCKDAPRQLIYESRIWQMCLGCASRSQTNALCPVWPKYRKINRNEG